MTKKYILINGAIRDIEEFSLIVDYVLSEINRSKDIILIISTWIEDIQDNRSLFEWLSSQGVVIVGSPGIEIGGPANVFRQWRTLEAGLSLIPEDAFVLKGRTDKFLLRKDVIRAFVSVDLSSQSIDNAIKNNILHVEHISITLPFMAKDMIYLGSPNAIRKTMSFSVRTQYIADHIFNGIGPECFLWLELASHRHTVMQLIQCIDFRQVSTSLSKIDLKNKDSWEKVDRNIIYLYKIWIDVFESNLGFLSDILDCRKADIWPINEGSWTYITGDREEFESTKRCLEQLDFPPVSLSHDTLQFINSTSIFLPNNLDNAKFILPFPDQIESIRNSFARESSDIVLIRNKIIQDFLGDHEKFDSVKSALKWNIRQRDRQTLDMTYQWLLTNDNNLCYLSDRDRVFILERKVDMFTFEQDFDSIEYAIKTLRSYFIKSPTLSIRLGEHFFKYRQLYRSAYYFWKAQKEIPTSLGANHGLGCVLLDLGWPKLALKYLSKAHSIMPSDQTATFTLLRAYAATKNFDAASQLSDELHGQLKIEAGKILNV